MKQAFHTDTDVTLLFKEWKAVTATDLLWIAILIGIVSLLTEGLQLYRGVLLSTPDNKQSRCYWLSWTHLLHSLCHMLRVTLSNVLMLALMSYNLWIFIAIILGSVLGYFIYGWVLIDLRSTQDRGRGYRQSLNLPDRTENRQNLSQEGDVDFRPIAMRERSHYNDNEGRRSTSSGSAIFFPQHKTTRFSTFRKDDALSNKSINRDKNESEGADVNQNENENYTEELQNMLPANNANELNV